MCAVVEDLLRIPESSEAAAWLADRIVGFGDSVVSLVPEGFPAYARVFHPPNIHDPTTSFDLNRAPSYTTWTEVARRLGRTAHPTMQWRSLVGITHDGGGIWHEGLRIQSPGEAQLPAVIAPGLTGVLRTHTAAPGACWFAIWEGWGGLEPALTAGPTFELPGRRYHLVEGPIDLATELAASRWDAPSLWWPSDRAWCVATEIDLNTTYVGGSRACVDQLLSCDDLEVYEAEPTDAVNYFSDTVNPLPLDG
jgi:hypothetical protein